MENSGILGIIITSIIAIVGWIIVIIQSYKNRRLEKANKLADRRFSAYNSFLNKMDDINGEMEKLPRTMMSEMTTSFLTAVMSENEDANKAVISFNEKLVAYVSDSLKPLLMMKQELSSLKLVASDKMLENIHKMEILTDDLHSEFQTCLSSVSPQNTDSFQNLKSMGQSERAKEFAKLYEEMTNLMRKEIQLS